MAQSSGGVGDILKYGLLLGGGYWLYTKFFSGVALPAAAPASTSSSGTVATGTPSTSTYPAWMANLGALASQLATMAGSPNQNVDQWAVFYDQLRQLRNMPELTGAQVQAIINASPTISANRAATISSNDFVNLIFNLGFGLAGYRSGMGAVHIQVPKLYRRNY